MLVQSFSIAVLNCGHFSILLFMRTIIRPNEFSEVMVFECHQAIVQSVYKCFTYGVYTLVEYEVIFNLPELGRS